MVGSAEKSSGGVTAVIKIIKKIIDKVSTFFSNFLNLKEEDIIKYLLIPLLFLLLLAYLNFLYLFL